MTAAGRAIDVNYDNVDTRYSGVSIESASAFLGDDCLVVIGEASSWTGDPIGDYREMQVVAYDPAGRLVGRSYTNWGSFGMRQSFTINLRMGVELFGIPQSVVLVPAGGFEEPVDASVVTEVVASFRPNTPNSGRVVEHDGTGFSVSGHDVPLVQILQHDRNGDLEWQSDAWQSWARAQRDSGLLPEHPLHEFGATTLDQLTGVQFEHLCEVYFARQGYSIERTPAVADGGVDLVLEAGGKLVLVQCKRHARPVGEPVLRDLFGAIQHRGADSGVVCSSSGFSAAARSWLGDKPIVLLDGGEIIRGLM